MVRILRKHLLQGYRVKAGLLPRGADQRLEDCRPSRLPRLPEFNADRLGCQEFAQHLCVSRCIINNGTVWAANRVAGPLGAVQPSNQCANLVKSLHVPLLATRPHLKALAAHASLKLPLFSSSLTRHSALLAKGRACLPLAATSSQSLPILKVL